MNKFICFNLYRFSNDDLINLDIESSCIFCDNEQFSNIGFCEEGRKIGNCLKCGNHGVIISEHECPNNT